MTSKEFEILTNIIGAVESGDQVYGQRNYATYAPPYNASPDEHTCTLGWCQLYGSNANKLLNKIYNMDKSAVPSDIVPKLNVDWVSTRWNPSASQKQSLIKAITSVAGKKCQDEMFKEITEPVIKKAESLGITDVGCQIMFVEIAHLGGISAAQRIFNKASKPYTVDGIFNTLMLDQKDTSNNNQVGDKIYQSRHECCVKWIKQYLYSNQKTTTTTTKGSDTVAAVYELDGNMISNSGSDEYGGYTGGEAGDQTQIQWRLMIWYSRPWNCVLRHPNRTVGNKISELAIKAAKNDKIGYDQGERYTYWSKLQAANYDPSKITAVCESDCSAGVIANTKAAGYILGIDKLKNIWATYTGNMRQAYKEAGFEVLTDSKYLNSPDYLLPGDILLNDVHHVATCVSTGSKVKKTTTTNTSTTTTTSASTSLNEGTAKWVGTTNRKAYVRKWAGSEYDQVSFSPVAKNAKVEVLDTVKDTKKRDWYFIRINGKTGFIFGEYVDKPTTTTGSGKKSYRVQGGAYSVLDNANATCATYRSHVFDAIVVKSGTLYIVQLGIFENLANAESLKQKVAENGFDVAIIAITN